MRAGVRCMFDEDRTTLAAGDFCMCAFNCVTSLIGFAPKTLCSWNTLPRKLCPGALFPQNAVPTQTCRLCSGTVALAK